MLSERQWNWLEGQLRIPDVDLRLIVSSVQVLNNGTGFEAWRHLPQERDRLYQLLDDTDAHPVLLLSGDRHVGAFSESNGLVEITSSSFTHTIPLGAYNSNCTTPAECDEPGDDSRIGDFIRENHFGALEIDWVAREVSVSLRRAASSPGSAYDDVGTDCPTSNKKCGDAGSVLVERRYALVDL